MRPYLTITCLAIILLTISCTSSGNKGKKKSSISSASGNKVIKEIKSDSENESQKESDKEPLKRLSIKYEESKEALKSYYEIPHIKEFYKWQMEMEYTKPPELKYPEDLSELSYEELRLLRNEVFARNGHLFNDGYLRGYFNRFKWYMPVFDVDTFKIVLNKSERKLINKLLKEESERKKDKTIDGDGLDLYNPDLIANSKQFVNIPEKIISDFQKQNFSIVNANRSMPFYVYDKNAYEYIPHYITTDLYLFILHKYFSRFLEKLDENFMYKQLYSILKTASKDLSLLSSNSNQSSIEWAKMYSTLSLFAIGDSTVNAPEVYADIFNKEKEFIEQQSGTPVFIKNEFVNYNELMPRGHYTKSDTLKKYFRGFKWISLNGINLNNNEQLKGLVTFAYVIKRNKNLYSKYKQYVSTIERIAGREDNLSLYDITEIIDTESISKALSEESITNVRNRLNSKNKEKIKKIFGESFKTPVEDKQVYFLSATYSISGDIFSKLVHIDEGKSKRPFPRGLDIPAVFGNKTAQSIVVDEYKDAEKWPEYLSKLKKLQNQFLNFSDWNHNYGFKGVQTALNAYAEKKSYPNFMKTDAYNRKELSTALSSWTHIKHDLILYQEKPYAAECGQGGGPEPPKHYSYVEPNIVFWESALELVDWLEKFLTVEYTFADELIRIKDLGIMLRDISKKQLNGETITDEEYNKLHFVGGTVEYILLALLETDHIPDREKSMALIADVYVYNGTNLNVAVGHADDIYVVVPIKGEYYIARGSVFSYYEFKGEIYDDEMWQESIEIGNTPERPEWLKPLINDFKSPEGNMQFRYPGYGM